MPVHVILPCRGHIRHNHEHWTVTWYYESRTNCISLRTSIIAVNISTALPPQSNISDCGCLMAAVISFPIGLTLPIWFLPLIFFLIGFTCCDFCWIRKGSVAACCQGTDTEKDSLFAKSQSYGAKPFKMKYCPVYAFLCIIAGVFIPICVYYSCDSLCRWLYDWFNGLYYELL